MADEQIFFSFARPDDFFVRSVADGLEKRGVRVSTADETQPGAHVAERLQDALRASSALVVFVGESVDSPWVNFEIGAAVGESKRVLPVFLTRDPVGSAPSVLREYQGIEASDLKPDEVADRIADLLASVA
jgi:hypothetical protein